MLAKKIDTDNGY